ncbi:MAG: putative toxin-antitoxin system toxin component, PIN family [Bryobacteraceae bacterium]
MSPDRPNVRAVFDCMVFLQGAARRESPAGVCLLLVELGAIELCLSEEIVSEIRQVLTRPRVRQKFPALTDALVGRFLRALSKRAIHIKEVPYVFTYERDPKDAPYINLSIAAGASHLVSRDADILDLAAHGSREGEILRRQAPQLKIVDPVSFLAEMRRALVAPGDL